MKKSERKAEIIKRAYQYARSGEHNNWLSIEHKLRFSDGFSEARTELDNPRIRQELDSLCKIATSPEESSRRREFNQWIDQIVKEVGPQVSNRKINLRHSFGEDTLSIDGPNYSLMIRRRFNCRKLECAKSLSSDTGTRYRLDFENVPPGKDFDAMSMEDVAEMIVALGDAASSMAIHM